MVVGGSSAYPMPRGPCVSGVVTSARASGVSRPSATSRSDRPAISRTARVFSATWRASTLPAVHVTATSSHSGEATAYSSARLSSMPVSQSTRIGSCPWPLSNRDLERSRLPS